MRALEIITGHVIYNPAYTYKFQLKTTYISSLLANFYTLEIFVLNSPVIVFKFCV